MYTVLAGLLLQQSDFIHQPSPEFLSLLQDRGIHFLGKCLHESHVSHEVVEKVLRKKQIKSCHVRETMHLGQEYAEEREGSLRKAADDFRVYQS